jgi:hypothetical protein
LHLTVAEKQAIVAFLKKLSGTIEEGAPNAPRRGSSDKWPYPSQVGERMRP